MHRSLIRSPGSDAPDARAPWLRSTSFSLRSGAGRGAGALLSFVAFLAVGGCRGEGAPSDPGLEMELAVSPTPPAVGPARLLITLQDTAGRALEEARITVEGNMSHAGMVPVLDTARAQEPGEYVVDDFDFTMAGDWVLTVEAILPDGRQAHLEHATTVVASPPGLMEDTASHSAPDTAGHSAPDTMGHSAPDTMGRPTSDGMNHGPAESGSEADPPRQTSDSGL